MNTLTEADMELKRQASRAEMTKRLSKLYEADPVKPAYAPFMSLGKEMIDRLPTMAGSILVLSDVGLLIAVLRRMKFEARSFQSVKFIAHTTEVQTFVQSLGVESELVGYNQIQDWLRTDMGLKFDIIVMNPPYGDLHLPILKKVVQNLTDDGICISVQPVRWLQDPLWQAKKNSDARKMQPVLEGKIHDIQVISAKEATEIFSAATMNMDLGIFTIKSGGIIDYKSLALKPHGVNISSMAHLFSQKSGFKVDTYVEGMQHFAPIIMISSGGSDRGFEACWILHRAYGYVANGKTHECKYGNGISMEEAKKNNKHATLGKLTNMRVKSFRTAIEAKNFFEFIKLESFRFFVYVTTMAPNIQCEYLPIPAEVDAFKKPWTDERFYEHFKIDAEGQAIIKETMKDKSSDPYGWNKA